MQFALCSQESNTIIKHLLWNNNINYIYLHFWESHNDLIFGNFSHCLDIPRKKSECQKNHIYKKCLKVET